MIGGWIADNASWRLAFFVSLPLAALALVVVWFGFGSWGRREKRQIDYVGAVLLTLGAGTGLVAAASGRRRLRLELTRDRLAARRLGAPRWPRSCLGAARRGAARAARPLPAPRRSRSPRWRCSRSARRPSERSRSSRCSCRGCSARAPRAPAPCSRRSCSRGSAASMVAGQIVSRTGRSRPVLLAGPPIMAVGFALLATMGTDGVDGRRAIRNVVDRRRRHRPHDAEPRRRRPERRAPRDDGSRDRVGAVLPLDRRRRSASPLMGAIVRVAARVASSGAASPSELAAALHPAFCVRARDRRHRVRRGARPARHEAPQDVRGSRSRRGPR